MASSMVSGTSGVAGRSRLLDRALVVLEVAVGAAVVVAIVGKAYGPAPTVIFLMTGSAVAFTGWVLVKMFTSLDDPTLEVPGRVEDEARAALEHEKLLLLQGIKELEADAAVGKVAAEDYDHLRRTAEVRALDIIQRIKAEDAKWRAEAERLVEKRIGGTTGARARGAAPAAAVGTAAETAAVEAAPVGTAAVRETKSAHPGLFDGRPVELVAKDGALACAACGGAAEADFRFCTACGRPITAATASAPAEVQP